MSLRENALFKIESSAHTGTLADLTVLEAEALVLYIRELENKVSAAKKLAETIARET